MIEGNHATSTSAATGSGGGVYIIDVSTTFHLHSGRIRNNIVANPETLSGLGGGVSVDNQARFYMYGGEIYGHENTFRGGGVYITRAVPADQTFPATAATASTFTMNGGIIRNNVSNWGGGVANMNHAQFNMHGGYIRNNHAIGEGPVIVVGGGVVNISGAAGSASLTMTGGTIEGNTSRGGAGGMWLNPANIGWVPANDTYISITGGTIRNNIAHGEGLGAGPTGFSYNGGGGGIFFTSEPRHGTTFGGPTLQIYGNHAYGETGGGGIKVHAQHITMTEGVIRDNFAYEYGGGVLVFPLNDQLLSGGTPGFAMQGGVIYYNDADRGGGVAVHRGMFTMQGGTIGNTSRTLGNTAVRGGGLYIFGGATATINAPTAQGAQILGNTASSEGGGIFFDSGQLNLTSGTVGHTSAASGNIAVRGGGIFMNAGTNLTLNNANAHIIGNTALGPLEATDGGGGIFLSGASTHLTLQNGLIDGNRASHGGGIRLQAGTATAANPARFTMTGGIVRNNRYNPAGTGAPTAGGGVFAIGLHAIATMSGGTIGASDQALGNMASGGGGVAVAGGAVFNLQSSTATGAQIMGNTAVNSGGGVWTGSNSQLNFTGGTIGHANVASGNTALRGGGAYARDGAVINMTHANARISGNTSTSVTALNGGGGVFIIGENSHLNLENGSIEHNRANRGGGVFVSNGTAAGNSWFNMSGGNIRNNRVNHNNTPIVEGGGVFVTGNNAQFNMTSGNIGTVTADGNRAINGGAVFVTSGSWFGMTGGNIRGNEAEHGGGVFVTGVLTGGVAPLFTMSGGFIGGTAEIQGNSATATTDGSGGGVRVHSQGRFYMSGGFVQHNSANRGGGVAAGGAVAAAFGALMYYDDYSYEYEEYDTFVEAELYVFEGYGYMGFAPLSAPIRPTQPAHTMTTGAGAQITHNTASTYGGGVHVSGGAVFNMPAGIISNNTAQGVAGNIADEGNGGGGVFVTGAGSHLMFGGGGIFSNRATRGGGIRLEAGNATTINPARVTMTGGGINNNRQDAAGGVITVGGGLYVSGANAVYTMYHGTIGGMPVSIWPFELNQASSFADANVALNGGGVAVMDGGQFYMRQGGAGGTPTHGTITGNVATDNGGRRGGGGILVDGSGSTFTMDNGLITRNTSEGVNTNDGGGGVLVRYSGNMLMHGGTISDNVAAHGAGVRTMGAASGVTSTFTMNNGIIEENRALAARVTNQLGVGGGVHIQNGTFTMNGGQIRNNRASGGGGVRVWGGSPSSNFIMTGGYIRGHSLVNNGGSGNGGGVSITNIGGYMRMYGGVIGGQPASLAPGAPNPYANVAGRQGGGVHVSGQGVFTMLQGTGTPNHGVISHNSATSATNAIGSGGGGVSVEDANTYFNMYMGTIQNNTAQLYGGGVHVLDGGMFNLRGPGNKTITGNQANYGGGVWLGRINVAAPGTPALFGQMRMQLTPVPAASGVHITNNTAIFMGGGIYTMHHCYNDPMLLVPASPLVPPFATNAAVAYSNMTLVGVTFAGNTANMLATPPSNRGLLTNLGFATDSTSQPASVLSADRHPLNNFDINYYSDPPVYVIFEFVKTDNVINPYHPAATPLHNAGFQLYRRPNSSSAWTAVGAPVFSNPMGVVQLSLSTDNQYRLVEVVPPTGFMVPFGYWILVVTQVGSDYVVSAVTSHGGNPEFRQHPPASGNWWVGNRSDFELPLTGGSGASTVIMAGYALLGMAGIIAVVVWLISVKKKRCV